MSMNDTLSDMLARIKNAHSIKKDYTYCLFSKLNLNVLKVLKEEGYIREYNSENFDNGKSKIRIELKNQKAIVSSDSHENISLRNNSTINISKAKSSLVLIHPQGQDFFASCRNKLGWSTGM